MTYVDDYMARLQQIRQSSLPNFSMPMSEPVSKSAFANLILQNARSNFNIQRPEPGKQDKNFLQKGKSVGLHILDILSRPLYGAAEAVDEIFNEDAGQSIKAALSGAGIKGGWEGLTGKEKTSFIDVLQAADERHIRDSDEYKRLANSDPTAAEAYLQQQKKKKNTSAVALGLAGDIILDPLNLVGVGEVTAPFKAIKGLTSTEKALQGSEKVLGAGETAAKKFAPTPLDWQAVPEAFRASTGVGKSVEELPKYAQPKDVFSRDIRPQDFKNLQKARVLDDSARITDQLSKGNPAAVDFLTHKLLTPLGPVARSLTNKVTLDTINAIRATGRKGLYGAPAQSKVAEQLAAHVSRLYKDVQPEHFESFKNMVRNAEESLIEHGRVKRSDRFYPRAGSRVDSPYLRLSDVLDTLPEEITRKALFGPKKIKPATLLNAVAGEQQALRALNRSHPDLFDAIHEVDWAPLMVKEHVAKTVDSANAGQTAVNSAADFIAAKLADESSDVSKANVTENVIKSAKQEFKNESPEVKNTIGDMLDGLRRMRNPMPTPASQIIEKNKEKFAAAVYGGKKAQKAAQGPRVDLAAEKVTEVLPTEPSSAKSPAKERAKKAGTSVPEASQAADAGIFSTVLSWINPAYGYPQLRQLLLDNVSVRRASAVTRANNITKIFSRIPENEQLNFWHEVRGYLDTTPEHAQAVSDMQKMIHNLFGESGLEREFSGNTAVGRAGIDIDHLNKHVRIVGIKDFKFQEKVPVPGSKKTKTGKARRTVKLEPKQVLNSWKEYQPKSPEDLRVFAFNLTQAVENAMVESSTYAQLGAMWGSKAARPGYIQVTGMHPAIDEMYFPKEIAPQIGKMAIGMDKFTEPLASSQFMRYYDVGLRTWKSSVTIYLPSHHIRNVIGDMFLAWLDGMNDPRYVSKSIQMMKANFHRYSDLEGGKNPLSEILSDTRQAELVSEIMGQAKTQIPKGTRILANAKVGGKSYPMTIDQIYQLGFRHGIFPHSSVIEDLPGSETLMEKLANKYHPGKRGVFAPAKGAIGRGARQVSETREHLIRGAHWIYALEHPDKAVNSFDELLLQAASRVRKYHPDGLDLTDVERKVFRRLMPFYSWTRKAIPLIAEGLVMKPAKIMAYPKVMSGLQEQQGIDSNVSNPWPDDQLFPDWLASNVIGPVLPPTNAFSKAISRSEDETGYTLVNPGNPATDLMNQFINNPVQGIGNSITPAIKIPAELAFKTEFQTGAPIQDYTDYANKNIPLIAPFSRLTHGAVGTGLLEGGDLQGKKETEPYSLPAFLNMMAAAGILDTGRYTKGGEFDLKKRIREQKANGSQ